jgi:hypothetical protein
MPAGEEHEAGHQAPGKEANGSAPDGEYVYDLYVLSMHAADAGLDACAALAAPLVQVR